MSMDVNAFIFDLDGVITDTAEYHYQAWGLLARELGIPFDRTFNERLKGIDRMQSLELILERGGMRDRLSRSEKEAMAGRKNDHYTQLIEGITPDNLLPGIAELLRDVREAGMGIGLASASRNAGTILAKLQIGHYFDTVVDPALLAKGKPDPEIFLKAAADLKATPACCVGVEDAEAGIRAIRGAGMFAVGVGTPEAMKEADLIVTGTAELNFEKIVELYRIKSKV